MNCRHCGKLASLSFANLGSAPPSNAYLTNETVAGPETYFPLRVVVCQNCRLVQTEDYTTYNNLFDADYAYFSSFSKQWLEHSKSYVSAMIDRLKLSQDSLAVEIAANDGYLLQFVQERGIPCLGIEPTSSTANAARAKGLTIVEEFFGEKLARELAQNGNQADLMIANNVLAHVPDINDFVAGFSTLLKPDGTATFEFPHLVKLVEFCQFDTIYHEHFSYLSLTAVYCIFAANGLTIYDVDEIPTHGGSLRVFAQRASHNAKAIEPSVGEMMLREQKLGVTEDAYYLGLQPRAEKIKNDLSKFLIEAHKRGEKVAAYGAAAKGNTLLNFAGIRPDLISYVVDRNPAKAGKFMPGSHIPIVDEARLMEEKPNYVIILPWNLEQEILEQLHYVRNWECKFIVCVPELKVI
jgi:SAM-dependent methyltransferase